jgi:hypothetical protein
MTDRYEPYFMFYKSEEVISSCHLEEWLWIEVWDLS